MSTGHLADAGAAAAHGHRRRVLLWSAAGVLLLAAAGVGAYALEREPAGPAADAPSVRPVVAAIVHLRPTLNAITVGAGGVWVTSAGGAATGSEGASGLLWRIDPRTNGLEKPIPLGVDAFGIAVGGGSVWTSEGDAMRRVAPRSGKTLALVRGVTGDRPVAGAGWIWVGRDRIDPRTNRIVKASDIRGVVELAGPLGVWSRGDVVRRIDPRTGRQLADFGRPTFSPTALAAGEALVWVAWSSRVEWELTSLSAIDPRTNRPVGRSIDLRGHLPAAVAFVDGYLWLLTHNGEEQGARLWQIDPRARRIVGRSLRLRHGTPFLLAAGEHALWIAEDLDEGTVTRVDLVPG